MNNKKSLMTAAMILTLAGCSSQSKQAPSQETLALGEQNQKDIIAPKQYISQKELLRKFEPVFFRFDSSDLTYDAQRKVQSMAESIKRSNPENPILINGYTDPIGTRTYNYVLAKSRALNVRNHLIELGVEPSQLKVVSYGEATTVTSEPSDYVNLRKVELGFNAPVLNTDVQQISYSD